MPWYLDNPELLILKNSFYFLVKRQLLRYQSSITGLFPVLSTDKEVASVRESVYCAAAIWSLYQAYRYSTSSFRLKLLCYPLD